MKANDIDYLADIDPDHLNCTIMTDGGGELSKSNQFRTTCRNHGYDVISLAADTSSQNGMVERPHRTLKERKQYLLYSAGLGTEYY